LLNFNLIADSIEKIIAVDEDEVLEVSDRDQILEFLNNCEASIGTQIEEQSSKISSRGINRDVKFHCEECDNVTEQRVTLDPVNFFTAS
jgi:hypothetical protein